VRALIELVKLQQASLEDLTLISIDCAGTYEGAPFHEAGAWKPERRAGTLNEYLAAGREGREPAIDGLGLRPACRMCVQPIADHADIRMHLIGADLRQGIPVTFSARCAAQLDLARMGVAEATADAGQPEAVERMIADRAKVRDSELAAVRAQLTSDGGLAGLFANCIRCHNCMTACPLCYCKNCLFRTAAFDHKPEHYLAAARRKGATRMLGDTLLFHMTRLNHMSASCVNCGMCTSACPSEIPVGLVFSAVGAQVQAAFGYAPGRSLAEPLPLVDFRPDEWQEVGEPE
jgi:formate dehydrogenase subunit beta